MAKKNKKNPNKNSRSTALEEKLAKLREKQQQDVADKDKGNLRKINVFNLSNFKEIEFMKPEDGKEIRDGIYTLKLDIIPFLIDTDVYPNPNLGKGDIDYVYDFWLHRGIGLNDDSIICPKRTYGKPCPICEEAEGLKKKGADEEKINALTPSHKVVYNVIDLNNPDDGIKLFMQSFALFQRDGWMQEKLIKEAEGEEIIYIADLENGRTIKCRAVKQKFKSNFYYKFTSIDFIKRKEAYDESILKETVPLGDIANILTYDEIHKIHFEIEDGDEKDVENTRRNAHVDEDGDDDDDDAEVGEDKFDKMDRKQLKKFIKDNELDIKVSKKDEDDDIRNKIREALEDDEDEEDEDADDNNESTDEDDEDDEEKKPPKKERSRGGKKNSESKGTCPHGHEFGSDCDLFDACDDCKKHSKCAKAQK